MPFPAIFPHRLRVAFEKMRKRKVLAVAGTHGKPKPLCGCTIKLLSGKNSPGLVIAVGASSGGDFVAFPRTTGRGRKMVCCAIMPDA